MEVSTASCSKIRDQQNPQSHLFREDFQSNNLSLSKIYQIEVVFDQNPQKNQTFIFCCFHKNIVSQFSKHMFFWVLIGSVSPHDLSSTSTPPHEGREVIAGLGPQPSPSRLALTWKPERCHTFLETTRRGMDGMDGPGDHVGHWTFLSAKKCPNEWVPLRIFEMWKNKWKYHCIMI